MSAALAGGVLLSVLLGWACVLPMWRSGSARGIQITMLTSLATGLGLGLSACVCFIVLLVRGAPFPAPFWGELALLAGLSTVAFCARKVIRSGAKTDAVPLSPGSGPGWTLLASLVVVVACAIAAFTLETWKAGHGGWDAWAIWNLRARFLFWAGPDWITTFAQVDPRTHPDYPLLLAGSVARLWSYTGVESQSAPVLVAMLFTFSSVTLVGSALAILRNASQGSVAVLLLLGLPVFVLHGASQTADIPVGFFLLATLSLFGIHGRLETRGRWPIALAGLAAGLGAWTKNEGLLIMVAVVLARCATVVRAAGWRIWLREVPAFLAGLMPVLFVLAVFKFLVAPPNDIIAGQGMVETTARVITWSRYLEILRGFRGALEVVSLGAFFSPLWLLVVYVVSVGLSREQAASPGFSTCLLTVTLVLGGYAVVYLITPLDLSRHLGTSADRLLLQLWPSVLFTVLLVARTPEEAS